MKHLMMTVVTVLTLGATMTMVKADTYQSGRDADIMRERGQVWNYSESKRDPQLANYNTDGRYLSEATNFELYNFVREYKTSDEIRRIWNPKKDESVSTIRITDSIDDGHKVYNFDSFAYQLPESTDFWKIDLYWSLSVRRWYNLSLLEITFIRLIIILL